MRQTYSFSALILAKRWACALTAMFILCGLTFFNAFGQTNCIEKAKSCPCQDIALRRNLIGVSTNSEGKCVATDHYGRKATDPNVSEQLKACQRCLGDATSKVEEKGEKPPIIFLPGVAGTELVAHWKGFGGFSNSGQAWPFSPRAVRPYLALAEDGKSVHENVRQQASDVRVEATSILTSSPTNFYGGIRHYLHNKGYQPYGAGFGTRLPQKYFEFPYDWRLDNSAHFEALDKQIDAALTENPKEKKVVLIAHSMGGVIARAYLLSRPQRAARVESLITIGTPYWGAPKPYYGMISGYTFGNPSALQPLMKLLMQNWPAAYQLMPNYDFVYERDVKRWLSFDEATKIRYKWFTRIDENYIFADRYHETTDNVHSMNQGLVKLANHFKAIFGTREKPALLPPGVKHYAIVGTGVKTLADFQVLDYNPRLAPRSHLELGNRKVFLLPHFHDGDGTVSLEGSVISTATTYYIPYISYNWDIDSSSGHGDLPANDTVQKIVGQILAGTPPDPAVYSYAKAKELIDLEEGVDFTLGSDARLSIKDEQTGRILGFNKEGGIEETFPSGSFIAMENVEYASIGDINRPVTAIVRGIRTGKFTLEVDIRRRGQAPKRFAFKEVAVEEGTIAQITLTPRNLGTDLPALSVNTAGQIRQVPAVSLPPPEDIGHPRLSIPLVGPGQTAEAGPFLGAIPSVGGTVTSFRFFTGDGNEPPPLGLREYQTRFSKSTLKVVYYELSVQYAADNEASFTISAIWKLNNSPFARQDLRMNKPSDWNTSTRSYGHGHKEPGKWEAGNYTVDIEVEGRRVASGSFEVY